ncbi:MAG: glycosyl hydrolase 2 galactose-binding domain-containing protein [Saccharofermentanales bacterium]
MDTKTDLDWTLGYCNKLTERPDHYIQATVPGAVQLDWMVANHLPHYNDASNVLQYEWMQNKFWHYRTSAIIHASEESVPFLHFESIEYRYQIMINDRIICNQEGIYTPVTIDLTDYSGQTIDIHVIIFPAPIYPGASKKSEEYSRSCKPPFAYGWDWSPRMIALGLCGEAYIEYLPKCRIVDFNISYLLNDSMTAASITIKYKTSQLVTDLIFSLSDFDGNIVYCNDIVPDSTKGEITFEFSDPTLWWPSGLGNQSIYKAILQIDPIASSGHRKFMSIGFRRIRLVTNKGTWQEQQSFPATQNKEPITIEINGKRIFVKGSNLVPFEMFPSLVNRGTYETILKLVKNAGMNLLRNWGGGYVHKSEFYELCDTYGIMIWQEFPLACSNYPDESEYLAVLSQESRSIVNKLKNHPSIAIWSGGNELFNHWSKMTSQSLAIRLLNSICLELDPCTPFISTSPLYGMGHGHYWMLNSDNTEVLTSICDSTFTAYTEFGSAAPSPMTYLKTFIPDDEIHNPKPGGSWELHHAFNAWRNEDDWLSSRHVKHFAGNDLPVEELINKGVDIQAYLYQYLFEEIRKQWPYASMVLNWCFNEPWPTAAGNSLVNYPSVPKPCYFSVKEALRDQKASLRIRKLLWESKENFEAEIWLLNTSSEAIISGTLEVTAKITGIEVDPVIWNYSCVEEMSNLKGPSIAFKIPEAPAGTFIITLKSISNPVLDAEYTLICRN